MRARSLTNWILGLVVIAVAGNWKCAATSAEEDLTLSRQERIALDKFKTVVEKYLYQDYMKKDIYLIKFLREKNLNIEDAKQMLLINFQWRRDNRIDGIMDEDFSKFQAELPVNNNGHDRTGRPIVTFDMSQLDVRRIILSGQKDTVTRYLYYNIEIAMRRLREAQAKGKIVTRVVVLANLSGFNLIQHGCGQCISLYINLIKALENSYPLSLHKFIAINTPPSFDVVLHLIAPVMTKSTQDSLEIYGINKRDWGPVIQNLISPDQIEKQFGGNSVTMAY